ncbi:MAG: energy transducer TonB [Myxococcales bacterium]
MDRAENNGARIAALLGASLVLHAALVVLLGRAPAVPPARPQHPLEVAVVGKPLPPPPAPVEPVPMKAARAPRRPAQDLPTPPAARVQPQPPTGAPPPPSREAAKTEQQPVVLPGITLESTSQGGSLAVASGNTLYAQPPRTATDPAQAKPYKADRYVAASQVNELPAVEGRPDSLRPFYPEAARQRGVEGDVVLRLLIDADGSLAKVDVIGDPGAGLGAAGARAIRQFRFRAGRVGGQPVATTITYTLHFVLD